LTLGVSPPTRSPGTVQDRLDALSQEVALIVDAAGTIAWRDARAARVLGTAPSLFSAAVPGTEAKIEGLIGAARGGTVRRFEVSLVASGRPSTFSFRGEPR